MYHRRCGHRRRTGAWAPWRALLGYAVILVAALSAAQGAPGSPAGGAAALFEKQCYSCHNIGGGDKKGPDLKGLAQRRTREWLHRFIPAPKALRSAGDRTAVDLFARFAPEEMPDQVISPDQIDAIFALIDQLSKTNKPFVPQSGRLSRQPTWRDVYPGYQLFAGRTRLAKGAPACISCHSIAECGPLGGGTLGPDLTQANVKYTDVELVSILKAPAFPMMSRVLQNRALTDEEALRLLAYLQRVKNRRPDPAGVALGYVGGGLAGTLAALGLMGLIWRGRLRGVRRPLVEGSRAAFVARRGSDARP